MYLPKIDDYLKILTDTKVYDFVAINFSEYVKSTRQEQNLRKVTKLLYIFLETLDEVEKLFLRSCNQILLIILYIAIMWRFWILLIENYNWLPIDQLLKKIKRIVKLFEKV